MQKFINVINKIISRRNILVIVTLPWIYYLITYFSRKLLGRDSDIFNSIYFPWNFVDNTRIDKEVVIWIFPVLTLFSIITYFLSDRIFKAWRNWTGIWLIPSILLILVITNRRGGGLGGWGMDELIMFPILFVYFTVSIIVILVTRWNEKHKK